MVPRAPICATPIPDYFVAHRDYVLDTVLPWAAARVDPALPRVLFGCSIGASWVAQLALERPEPSAAVHASSVGVAPVGPVPCRSPRYALVAGRLEAGFDRTTTGFARRLRLHGVPVQLRRRVRGHDASMRRDDFLPALRWALDR